MKEKFKIQDDQYQFPYHHLVGFAPFTNYAVMPWGFEYYAYVSKVLELLAAIPFSSLLDVGCGEGKLLLEANKRFEGKMMRGIDLSERAILFAQAFNFGNGVEFAAEDVRQETRRYDVVTLVETIEHVPDEEIRPFIEAVFERVQPGGTLIATVPTTNFPLQAKHYRHYDLPLMENHLHPFKLKQASYLVKQNTLYTALIRLSRKFCSFGFVRNALLAVARTWLFHATPATGRHLVCVFEKPAV